MKVERFFHIRTGAMTGGATVLVSGDTEHVGQVDLKVAFCSPMDAFCKKTGRESASKVDVVKIIPLRYLGAELERVYKKAARKAKQPIYHVSFDYGVKYFLPKE